MSVLHHVSRTLLAIALGSTTLLAGTAARAEVTEPVVPVRLTAPEHGPGTETRYELLDPDAGVFRVVDIVSERGSGETHWNYTVPSVTATDIKVIDTATGAEHRTSWIAGGFPDTLRLTAEEVRPIPENAVRRMQVEWTMTAPSALSRHGANILFEMRVTSPRATVILPPRYEVVSCNYPCQFTTSNDGRSSLSLRRDEPGEVTLRIEAAPLRGSHIRAGFGEPAPTGIAIGRESKRNDFDFEVRASDSRDIVYFLQQPETHAFRLFHDYTETRAGRDKYLNEVRAGSSVSDPVAWNLDTGKALDVETFTGVAITTANLGLDGPIVDDTQVVVARYTPLSEGESIRLRIEETYSDTTRYVLSEDMLIWDRAFGRGTNSVVLPGGWYPVSSAMPATFLQLEDGRTQLNFKNPSPDRMQVLILGRRRVTPEAYTVGGKPLEPDEVLSDKQRERERNLLAAWRSWMANPVDEQKTVVYARHLAWYGRFQDAVAVYADGLKAHPESYRLLRHRGHRLITLRRFEEAARDLAAAAPLAEAALAAGEANRDDDDTVAQYVWSSWYHLGLAEYYRGNFDGAEAAFRATLRNSATDDKRNAASYWLCNTLWRMGRGDETTALLEPVREGMDVQDNISYYELLRIFKGLRTIEETIDLNNPQAPRFSTVAYGVANFYWYKGEKEKARELYERIMAASAWNAFGNLGAEVALKELSGQ